MIFEGERGMVQLTTLPWEDRGGKVNKKRAGSRNTRTEAKATIPRRSGVYKAREDRSRHRTGWAWLWIEMQSEELKLSLNFHSRDSGRTVGL